MAITSLDGAIAGMLPPFFFQKVGATMEAAGVYYTTVYLAGNPGAIATPAAGVAGEALTTLSGQIPFPGAVGGESVYLARFTAAANVAGRLLLVDRLWQNSGIVVTTTTAQTIGSVAFPARDRDGAVTGNNVLVGMEVRVATTNAGAVTNTTMTYTDATLGGGQVATIPSFPATAVAGTFVPFALPAGGTGVGAIASVTLGTSYGAGAVHLVAYRVLASVAVGLANVGADADLVQLGMPLCYANTVPTLIWLPSATTAVSPTGEIVFTQG